MIAKLKSQEGIALLFVILIMSVILTISLGISAVLIKQIKTAEEIGDSVVAFYAADSGIEKVLYDLYKSSPRASYPPGPCGDASFEAEVKCGASVATDKCPLGSDKIDPTCDAPNFCLKSIGNYQKTKRAIETKY